MAGASLLIGNPVQRYCFSPIRTLIVLLRVLLHDMNNLVYIVYIILISK